MSQPQYLSTAARQKMEDLIKFTALAYGAQVGQQYAATPSVAQTLNDKIVEDGNWFLQMINVLPVSQIQGEKVLMSLNGNVASRTDTSGAGERAPKNLANTDPKGYQLYKTDFDTAIKYNLIDTWAKFPDFRERYGRQVRQAIGNDRVKIGWNGTSVAATSVAADLSDMNLGWLEQIRTYNGGSQYVLGSLGSVTLGSATFPNLDTLVHDARQTITVPFRQDPDLVVLLGDNVLQYSKGAYYAANGNQPSEKKEIEKRVIIDTYGGLPAYAPPFFDPDSILITSFANLSLYYQDSSVRRSQVDNPKKDQYEDYLSDNEGYVVEDFDKTSLVQGIEYA